MSRIFDRFEALRASGRKAVVPYIVAGDPFADTSVDLMHELVAAGADVIELGVPFSDPMSEGPVIQRGHERALERGIRLRSALEIVSEFRTKDTETPVLLMGYANPVEHMGYASFADAASNCGVDALLTVDIPPEEVEGLNQELRRVGMDNIFLIAPTTPTSRMELIAAEASGFIYAVSLKGVTGAGHLDQASVAKQVDEIRQFTTLPVCVGFGIKDGESAATVAKTADGVVVGSALVDRLATVAAESGEASSVFAAARELIGEIRTAVDQVAKAAA